MRTPDFSPLTQKERQWVKSLWVDAAFIAALQRWQDKQQRPQQ